MSFCKCYLYEENGKTAVCVKTCIDGGNGWSPPPHVCNVYMQHIQYMHTVNTVIDLGTVDTSFLTVYLLSHTTSQETLKNVFLQ